MLSYTVSPDSEIAVSAGLEVVNGSFVRNRESGGQRAKRPDARWSLDFHLRGHDTLADFGHALKALGAC